MRIAALYDIHGNVLALDAVLDEVARNDVDAIVIGGDIAWGPHPRETVERLMRLEGSAFFIRGNADREVAERLDESGGLDRTTAEINTWCSDRLTDEQRAWLADQALTATVHVDGLGTTLFCHGSPRSDAEIITAATDDERLIEALGDAREEIVVCGHTHHQFDRGAGGRRVINAGSVGLPYEGRPGAYWALFGPDVSLRRTAYDVDVAAERMRASGCPHVDDVFIEPITRPPHRDDVIRHFEAMAGRSA